MILCIILDLEESYKTKLLLEDKTHCKVMDLDYKIRSFYLVISLTIHLQDNMTYCTYYHFDEIIFLSLKGENQFQKNNVEFIRKFFFIKMLIEDDLIFLMDN